MNIAFINGSPKPEAKSNSGIMLNLLKSKIGKEHTVFDYHVIKDKISDGIFEKLNTMDVFVLSFPLYVDAIPSHLFAMMVQFEEYRQLNDRNKKNISVYAIMNNGFYEGKANHIALKIVENWCVRSGLSYGQGIGQGAGEMMSVITKVPLGHGPLKNLGKVLDELSENILSQKKGETRLFSPNFPYFGWLFMANNAFWIP
ncbi:MAG: hypothetical protein LBT13_10155, partial [Treponema sp.]|nr:hypothetical protein [Treponema sp.]